MANTIRVLSLCSGAAGLDLGFGQVFDCQHVAYVEREGYAAANLAARIREGRLDPAPIFTDVQRFNAEQFSGCVDAVLAGFPCPPVSVAGQRKGIEDERWLWPDVWRVARETGAWMLGLENVAGLVSAGDAFGSILADLAESGWSAEWLCLRASDVGASHRRARWFCLAVDDSERPERRALSISRNGGSQGHDGGRQAPSWAGEPGEALGDSLGARTDIRPEGSGPRRTACESSSALANTVRIPGGDRAGRERVLDSGEAVANAASLREHADRSPCPSDNGSGAACQQSYADDRFAGLTRFAPGPNDPRWPAIIREFPELVPAYSVESQFRRVADELADRMDRDRSNRLRLCGNGVVIDQAAAAFRELRKRLT